MKSRHPALASAIVIVLMLVGCRQSPALTMSFPENAPLGAPAANHECTSFCLENDGTCVFGTNHDNSIHEGILYVNKRNVSKTGWEQSATGEVARWTSKYGSFTFNLVGYQLPWAGMNETGLVISTMSLEETKAPAPDDRPPLESPLWLQYQLDNSNTVEEIVASDSLVRYASLLPGCCHYLACDRTGTCATIEFLNGEMLVHVGNTLPVAALSNSIYEDSVQAWHERSREELAGNEGRVSSLFRFAIAADGVTGFKPTDSESAVAYAFDTLAQANNPWTVWSIVFDSENLQVHFRTTSNSQIRALDLNRLDFTCGTPVHMLDIHADLRGDIEDDLEAYSHDVSLDHFVNVLGKLALGNRRDQLESLMRHMESFPCVDGGEHVAQDTLWYSWWTWLIGAAVLVVIALAVWHGARRRVERR